MTYFASVYVKNQLQRAKFDEIFKNFFGNDDEKFDDETNEPVKNKKFLRAYNYTFKIQDPPKY